MAKKYPLPKKHHLDPFADRLVPAIAEGDPDEMLDTPYVAALLHVSEAWLEIGRCKGYGPPFVKIGPRMVRYPAPPAAGLVARPLEDRGMTMSACSPSAPAEVVMYRDRKVEEELIEAVGLYLDGLDQGESNIWRIAHLLVEYAGPSGDQWRGDNGAAD